MTSSAITLLFQGSRGHLWFLISLLLALGIVTLLIKLDRKQWILPIASLLYCFGLIAGSYSTTPFGIEISFNTRNGPFFSTLFVATGWILSSGKYKLSSKYAFGLAAIGMIMHMTEVLFLWKFYHISPINHDYFIGTFFWGAGFTMFIISIPNAFQQSQITKWGCYVLGIYLVQIIIIDVLTPLNYFIPFPLWDIIHPFLVFFLSLITVITFSKYKITKILVTYN